MSSYSTEYKSAILNKLLGPKPPSVADLSKKTGIGKIMGFIFEKIATFIAGMISQHHQDGKLSLTHFFCIFWVIFFISFMAVNLLDGSFLQTRIPATFLLLRQLP